LKQGNLEYPSLKHWKSQKHLDSLNPKLHLIYLSDNDLNESIINIKKINDVTQIDLNNFKIKYGSLKAPFIKKILYNWKFMYYLYGRFPPKTIFKKNIKSKKIKSEKKYKNIDNYNLLLDYITNNYKVDSIYLF